MLIQQQKPRNIGFAPLFTSLTMLVFIPIAAIAITMRNLLSVLSMPALVVNEKVVSAGKVLKAQDIAPLIKK